MQYLVVFDGFCDFMFCFLMVVLVLNIVSMRYYRLFLFSCG